MPGNTPDFNPSLEALCVRPREVCPPDCEGLRLCAAVTALVQLAIVAKLVDFDQISVLVRACFTLCGFLLTGFLLRERELSVVARAELDRSRFSSWVRVFTQVVPVFWLILTLAGIFLLPELLTLKSLPAPDLNKLPSEFGRMMFTAIPHFLAPTLNGISLLVWPLIVLVAPRQILGLVFMSVLGSGLAIQILSLFEDRLEPVSIVVGPSAMDLMAIGSLLALIFQRDQDEGHGKLGRWSVLTGLALAVGTLIYRYRGELSDWGSMGLLSAPAAFGLLYFIGEILATVMVASLSWRDIDGMLDGLRGTKPR